MILISHIEIIIDSGATVNIDQTTDKTIRNAPLSTSETTKTFSYQSDNPIDLLGHFTTNISCNNKTHQLKIYVVRPPLVEMLFIIIHAH